MDAAAAAAATAAKHHVVCIPLPAQGHLPPIVFFSKLLAKQGLTVTLINIDSIHKTLEQSWKPVPEEDIRLVSIPLVFSIPAGFDASCMNEVSLLAQALLDMEGPLTQLLQDLSSRGPPISCVVSDFYMLPAPHSAKRAGFPSVCWWPGSAAWSSIEYHMQELLANGDVPVPDNAPSDKIVTPLPGLEQLSAMDLPMDLRQSYYDNLGGKFFVIRSARIKLESWVLVNSVHELEAETFGAMQKAVGGKFLSVGPLFPSRSTDNSGIKLRVEDGRCLAWLEQHPPGSVLYVAFGSIYTLSFQNFRELAEALKGSGQTFLWVLHAQLVVDMCEDYLQTFIEETQGRGLVVPWAPQVKVLQHASTGGFLTHCGWNSIMESIFGGVPMLGWPLLYDQNTNCKLFLEKLGLGLPLLLKDGAISRQRIQAKIKELMSPAGEKIRSQVQKLCSAARNAAAPSGSSHAHLEDFIQAVRNGTIA